MNSPKDIIRYKSMRNLLAKFFNCPPGRVKEFTVGLHGGEEISIAELEKAATRNGVWGFSDNGVIRFWAKEDCSFEAILEFLAHEIGHLNGRQYKDFMKEELKANEFQDVAMYAYKHAVRTWIQ